MSPAAKLSLQYSGPPGMSSDELGGLLEPGETYEAPSKEIYDELLAHPAGWFSAGKAATKET